MLNKKTIFIAAAGVAASVLLFKGIRKVAGTVKEKLASTPGDLEDLADSQDDAGEDGCDMEACDCDMEACDCRATGMLREKKACDFEVADCCDAVRGDC